MLREVAQPCESLGAEILHVGLEQRVRKFAHPYVAGKCAKSSRIGRSRGLVPVLHLQKKPQTSYGFGRCFTFTCLSPSPFAVFAASQ
jgi:hypothetical protein